MKTVYETILHCFGRLVDWLLPDGLLSVCFKYTHIYNSL